MKTSVPEDKRQKLLESYNLATFSFIRGHVRLMQAQIAYYKSSLAIHTLRLPGQPARSEADSEADKAFSHLNAITFQEFEAFTYLTNSIYLIYATTLFDTFITESTRFLLLLFPKALGKKQTVSIEVLLETVSRPQIITDAIEKKVRELGHDSFLNRLSFLRETFGLNIPLSDEDKKELDNLASMRNAIIHDQRVYELTLDDSCSIITKQRACPRQPTPVNSEQFERAEKFYRWITSMVYESIVREVLHCHDDSTVQTNLSILRSEKPKVVLSDDPKTNQPSSNVSTPADNKAPQTFQE